MTYYCYIAVQLKYQITQIGQFLMSFNFVLGAFLNIFGNINLYYNTALLLILKRLN